MQNKSLLFLTEIAIFSALALLLDYISGVLSLQIWAQGGSISLTMIPIMLIAFRWGLKGGLTVGLITGILQIFITSPHITSPLQGALDYPLAFASIGLAGIFASQIRRAAKNGNKKSLTAYLIIGAFIGSFARYICHVTSGIVYFASYAPEEMNATLYSFIYNASYMLPSFVLTAVLLATLFVTRTQLLKSPTVNV